MTTLSATNAVQYFTVTASGLYTITGYGAGGGYGYNYNPGGAGAEVSGNFYLQAGETLKIIAGSGGSGYVNGGGGGASAVLADVNAQGALTPGTYSQLLLVAGGGGGGSQNYGAGADGSAATGAAGGGGGGTGRYYAGGGGGGVNGDGASSSGSYFQGGHGGSATANGGSGVSRGGGGGFGGGGSGAYFGGGGGGGFTGGNGGYFSGGGGGTSFDAGTPNPSQTLDGANGGDGRVEIVAVGSGSKVTMTPPGTTVVGTGGASGTGVLAGESDPNGGTLSITSVTGPSGTAQTVAPNTTAANGGTFVTGTYGNLVIGADGSYSYADATTSAQGLAIVTAAGAITDTFADTVSSSDGGSSTSSLAAITTLLASGAETVNDAGANGKGDSAYTIGATTLTLTNDTATTYGGTIQDGSSYTGGKVVVTNDGTNSLTLTGSSAFTGGLTVAAGRVVESDTGNALGRRTVAIAAGATVELAVSGGNYFTQAPDTFTGAGKLVKTGTGVLTFGGNGGNTTISLSKGALIDVQGGTLGGSSYGQGIWTNNQASLNVAAGATLNTVEAAVFVDALTGSGTYAGGYAGTRVTTIGVAGGSGTFSGTLQDNAGSGALAIVKTGAGTETLTGNNTFTGGLAVDSGRIVESDTGNALGRGTTAISSGATVELFNGNTAGYAAQQGTTFSGSGTLQKTGAGEVDFGAAYGTVTVALGQGGSIDVEAGTLKGSNGYQADWTNNRGGLTIAGGATFDGVEGTIAVDALTGAGTLQGGYDGPKTTTIGVAGGSGTFAGTIKDDDASNNRLLALTKAGAGAEILIGTDTHTGGTTITGGTLQIGDGTATGGLSGDVVDDATLAFDPGTAGGAYAGNVSGSGIVTKIGAGTETLSGALNIAGVVAQAGTLVLNGPLSGSGAAPDGGSRFAAEVAAGATLTNNGAITATNDDVDGVRLHGGTLDNAGTIAARNYSGVYSDIGGTVNNTGSISSGPYGVLLRGGPDTASLTVTGHGSITATGGRGIEANTGSGAITLGTAGAGALGAVTGSSDGIVANTTGAGAISIVTGANVTGSGGAGIAAFASGSGAISVSAGGGIIRAAGDGIDATSNGAGAIVVNQSGGQIGTGAAPVGGYGIFAVNNGGGTTSVTAGTIVSSNQGVVAITSASGDATVATKGNITAGGPLAVNAQVNGGDGNVVVTTAAGTSLSANDVNDQNHFVVNAQHDGSGTGAVQVTNAATLTRPNGVAGGVAIRALNGTSGMLDGVRTAVSVANTGTITDNFATGISAQATGAGAVAVSNAGSIAVDGTGLSVAGASASDIVSNSGTVSGAVGLEVDGGTTTLNNAGGTITGTTAAIRIDGDSTLALDGRQAGTIVGSVEADGQLAFTGAGSFAFGNDVGGSGNVAVSRLGAGQTATLSGALTNAGGLTVADASNVTLTGSYKAARAIQLNGGTFTNQGTTTTGDDGILAGTTADTTIVNAAGATIEGSKSGVIDLYGNATSALTVTNAGLIKGDGYDGVTQHGSGALTVTNTGTIYGQHSFNFNGYAVGSDGGGALTLVSQAGGTIVGRYGAVGSTAGDRIVNSGTIASGTLNGDGSITVGGIDGVQLLAGGTVTNRAGGLIEGAVNGVVATGVLTLSNSGTIASTGNDAVFASGASATVLNAGTGSIAASTDSAVTGSTGLSVTNAAGGTLTGGTDGTYGYAVQLAGDSGIFDNYGTASGSAGGVLANHNLSGGGGVKLRLFAGSDTGAIKLDDVANDVSVYTGAAGAAEVDGTDPATGAAVVLRAAGTYGAAVVGDIALGNGGSVLNLRGTGDGTAANGAAGAIAGVVSGRASVVKLDSGTFVLSGANTYTGGTSLVAGTLDLATATAAGTGAVTFANAAPGATLAIERAALDGHAHFADTVGSFAIGDTLDLRGIGLATTAAVDGNGLLTVRNGAGALETIQLADLQSGDAFVLASDGMGGTKVTLTSLSGAGGLGVTSGGTVVLGSAQAGAVAGPVRDDGTLAFDGPGGFTFGADVEGSGRIVVSGVAAGSTATFSGALTQSGGFTVADASRVVLTGSSSGAGGTTISGGTLQIGDGTATGMLGGDVVDDGTLAFDPGTKSGTFAGDVSGSGIVEKIGAGTETLTGALTEGGLDIRGGTLALGATATLATAGTAGLAAGGSGAQNQAAVAVTNGATFSNAGTVTAGDQGVLLQGGTFTNTGSVTAASQSGVFAASGAVAVANTGAISGANGVDADLGTTDAVSVAGNGSFTGTNGFGIRGVSRGGDVTLGTAGTGALGPVAGAGNGIIAATGGAGAISVVAGANVTGSGGVGISATASGSGAVSVSASGGTVTGGNGDGIDATTSGTGAVSVTTAASETILATGNGITASSTGAGTPKNGDGSTATDVSVTNAGAIRHTAASGNGSGSGISADTAGAGFLAVTNSGAIGATGPAFIDGLVATRSNAAADVTVTNSGAIGAAGDAVTGTGILAFTQGGGNASVSVSNTAAITSSGDGIGATDTGNGNVHVTGNGAISAGGIGIRVTETGSGGAFVGTPDNDGSALGAITAGGTGIAASATGGGGITVYSGAVTSTGGSGIVASVTGGTGAIAVTTRGDVSGKVDGISLAGGSAANAVTNAFKVSGAVGLEVSGGTTVLTNSGVIASTAAGGNALQVDAGTLVLGDSIGTVTGKIGLQASGSTLVLAGSGTQAIANAITGSGVLSKTGSGTVTLSGASTYTGGTSLVAGTGAITFANAAGRPGATLAIERAALDGHGHFADTVGSFAVGDTLDLRGIGLASTASVDAKGVLTIGDGAGALETIQLADLQSGDGFVLTSDGMGGTRVTLVADAGPTIAAATPMAVEQGQTTVVGIVTPGVLTDPETLTQTSGAGTLTLGAARADGSRQVLYTAPKGVASSRLDAVTYTVANQNGTTASGAASVQLDAGATIATAAPAAVEKGQQTVVGTVTPGLAGDTLTLTQTAGSGRLTLGAVQKDGTQQVLYTAPASVAASGIDKVAYTVADQHMIVVASGSNGVQLDAGATIAASVPAKVGHGQTVTIGTATPGLSGDTLTLVQTKGSGTLSLVDGAIRYTAPNSVTAGQSDAIAYTIQDQHRDATAAASASIVLDPGPTASGTTLTVGHNQVLDVTTLVNGLVKAGLAGDAETITSLTAAKGTAAIGATGKLTYTSGAGGGDTLAYTVTDQLGETASGSVALTVDAGPTLTAISSTAKLGQSIALTGAVLAAATPGLKGDVLTVTSDDTTGTAGTVSLNNGVLTYTASGAGLSHIPANGSRTDSFVYTVSDQYGDTASATAKVTVTNPATVINGPFFGFGDIQGTSGADVINASGFFNRISSNGGNDVINAGLGNATVTTGAGDVVTNLQGFFDIVSGGDGWNTVSGSAGNASVTLGNGDDSVSTGGYGNSIRLGNGTNRVVAGQGLATVAVGSGQNSVTLAGFFNSVTAGGGRDVVTGGDGLATVTLGDGDDTVALGGWSNTIKVGSGTNAIVAGSGLATVVAGAGTDAITLAGTGNAVTLNGSRATVSGGQGNDTVTVNGGTDALTFAGWNDRAVLNGVAAVSIMDLGNALRIDVGSSTQTDTVANFGSKDTSGLVDLPNGAGGYKSVNDIMNALHDDGHGGTMLALGTTGSIDFVGTSKSQLHASNFKVG